MAKKVNKLERKTLGFIILAIIAGCASINRISLVNLASLYQEDHSFISLPALVFHSNDSSSLVITEIQLGDLQYDNIGNTGLKACSYRLSYRLLDNYETYNVLDSGSVVSGDTLNIGRNISILQSFLVKAKRPGKYLLDLELADLNREESIKKFIDIDKSSYEVRQNFMVVSEQNYPVFKDYLDRGENVMIVCNDPTVSELHVRCYFRDFPLAIQERFEGNPW